MLLCSHDTEKAWLMEPCFLSCKIAEVPRVVEPYCRLPTMGHREGRGYVVMLISRGCSGIWIYSHPIPPRRYGLCSHIAASPPWGLREGNSYVAIWSFTHLIPPRSLCLGSHISFHVTSPRNGGLWTHIADSPQWDPRSPGLPSDIDFSGFSDI